MDAVTVDEEIALIRADLWSPENLDRTGIDETQGECDLQPVAYFTNTQVDNVVVGQRVLFYDASYQTESVSATQWSWEFEGGTPATSTEKNPSVNYLNPGIFDVRLTINSGASTEYRADYVNVAENTDFTVALTSPAQGAAYTAPATIAMEAVVNDPTDSWSKTVKFYQGTQLVCTAYSTPYAFYPCQWANVAAGAYSLTVTATDSAGIIATSAVINVTVNANSPPTVSITSPTSLDFYVAPSTFRLIASANDSDGVKQVEFYQNDLWICTDTEVPYDGCTWANVGVGSYKLTAKATDLLGKSATSPEVLITIKENNTPPVASSQSTYYTNQDTSVAIGLSGSDADGDSLSYNITVPPVHGSLSSFSGLLPATVQYTPSLGFSGTDALTFVACDYGTCSDPRTVSISINGKPQTASVTLSMAEDSIVSTTPQVTDDSVYCSRSEKGKYVIVKSAVNGVAQATSPPDCSTDVNMAYMTYAPNSNWSGTDGFDYQFCDINGLCSATAHATVTVKAVNDKPVATNSSVTVAKNTEKTIALTANDAEGDSLVYNITTKPTHGTLTYKKTIYYTGTTKVKALEYGYKPTTGYVGTDSLIFSVSDQQLIDYNNKISITVQ
jgi:hypothetical protein